MANPSPKTDHLKSTRWKKGESPNPGGKTSEQRNLEIANAEKATRIRAKYLDALEAHVADGASVGDIDMGILRMLKDSEERGLGSPEKTVNSNLSLGDPLAEFFEAVGASSKRIGVSEDD